jgi:hypothetical protein
MKKGTEERTFCLLHNTQAIALLAFGRVDPDAVDC